MTDPDGYLESFERRVAADPDAPAVVCDGAVTTFAELDRAAGTLARRLHDRGVGPESVVGVLVDRSPGLAVAILGVLKAGAAFLPMDPGYPRERLAFMLADAGARPVVTRTHLEPALAGTGADLLSIDELTGTATATDDPLPRLAPGSLAYVIYTSGSTGRPKGAMIEHRSLAAFARDVVERLGLGAGDRFLQFASPGFDVLVEELFPTWLAGGAVVIPTKHLISGEDDLVSLIERERITVIELPTAYWHEWVRDLDRRGRKLPPCLRLVIIGGERVLPQRLAMWRRLEVPLSHVYGLTETTVSSTFFRLDPTDPNWDWPNLPIGTPMPFGRMRVLDRRLRPVPRGGTGELYIGGVSVGRGYLGRPGLTAQRFVADPDPTNPGGRLYRTGDLVRRRPDGNLEFISRVDTQIKVRGFRVEPMEIESTLARHEQVGEAIVNLHEPEPGDRRLVAYVVARAGAAPSPRDLRRFLENELPPYMVPSAFVLLDALPLNANGKVDRERLPSPDGERPELSEGYAAPRTPTEQTLADTIAAVVGVAKVGIHDNFFEIGGDSILAIQVVARAQEAGLRLTPYDVFVNPTVAALGEAITAGVTIDAEQGEVTGPVPLVPMQRGFCGAGLTEPPRWNTYALIDVRAVAEDALFRAAVERVVAHHDGLRQQFLLAGAATRSRIVPAGGEPPFEVHDLAGVEPAAQDDRLREAVAAMRRGLDPAVGPLLRIGLFRLGGGRPDRAAVVAHRLVADTVSVRIILDDLETAMVQLTAGEDLRFLPKTTSWQSWGRRLSSYGRSEAVEAERGYWTSLVTAGSGRLPAAPAHDDEVAAPRTITVALAPDETEALLARVTEALGGSVEELLLAALARTLTGWSGADRHVVDVERHDRDHDFADVDLNRTVGWFSRTHPVALHTAGSPASTLDAVKESWRSVPGHGLGWQVLRQDDVDPVPATPAQLAFTYLGREFESASGAFAPATLRLDDEPSPRERLPRPIDVSATVERGSLTVRWRHGPLGHDADALERRAEQHLDEVRALIALTERADAARTAVDFPLARVDQSQLTELLGRL